MFYLHIRLNEETNEAIMPTKNSLGHEFCGEYVRNKIVLRIWNGFEIQMGHIFFVSVQSNRIRGLRHLQYNAHRGPISRR